MLSSVAYASYVGTMIGSIAMCLGIMALACVGSSRRGKSRAYGLACSGILLFLASALLRIM